MVVLVVGVGVDQAVQPRLATQGCDCFCVGCLLELWAGEGVKG